MEDKAIQSVGLGGDGDEIHAIIDVEEEFEVVLDHDDAKNWITAGDVYLSLCKKIPQELANKTETWDRFTHVLCQSTGVDPAKIQKESPLLSPSLWLTIANPNAGLWTIILLIALSVIVIAVLQSL